MCATAYLELRNVCDRICDGSVTCNDLIVIKAREVQVRELCMAITAGGKNKQYNFDAIKTALECRNMECDGFLRRKSLLLSLCKKINCKVEGRPYEEVYTLHSSVQ